MTSSLVTLVVSGLVCTILGLVGLAIAVGLGLSIFRQIRLQAQMREQWNAAVAAAPAAPARQLTPQEQDLAIPLRRWGQSAVFILTGSDDYGYWPAHAPQKMLDQAWGITDGESARGTIESLLDGPDDPATCAFDRVRAIHIARAAAGAGYVGPEESWGYVRRAAESLRRAYTSWNQVGDGYLASKNAWLADRGIPTADGTEEKVDRLKREVWPYVPFDGPL